MMVLTATAPTVVDSFYVKSCANVSNIDVDAQTKHILHVIQ